MQTSPGHAGLTKLIDHFPDFTARGFDQAIYEQQFRDSNIIIKAKGNDISYAEHWGPLSIKTCIRGNENYLVGKRFYKVNEQNFLVLNEGQYYSSYIYSDTPVESFTINFTTGIQSNVCRATLCDDDQNIGDPFGGSPLNIVFTERLFQKVSRISSLLTRLKNLSEDFCHENERINEHLFFLLETLIRIEQSLDKEIDRVNVTKSSTKRELYKRLHFVKDYMDSSYQNNITLEDLACVANLNSAYLLRKFKNLFSLTPRQYIIKKRMEIAADLLKKSDRSITEICHETGYSDLTSFGKLFKHFYHCSPEVYRRR